MNNFSVTWHALRSSYGFHYYDLVDCTRFTFSSGNSQKATSTILCSIKRMWNSTTINTFCSNCSRMRNFTTSMFGSGLFFSAYSWRYIFVAHSIDCKAYITPFEMQPTTKTRFLLPGSEFVMEKVPMIMFDT